MGKAFCVGNQCFYEHLNFMCVAIKILKTMASRIVEYLINFPLDLQHKLLLQAHTK